MRVEKSKIGQYFIFIGVILLVVFFASGSAQNTAYGYFFAGLALVFLGGFFFIRGRKPVDPNIARFRTVRKFRERKAKRKEEREQRKRK